MKGFLTLIFAHLENFTHHQRFFQLMKKSFSYGLERNWKKN